MIFFVTLAVARRTFKAHEITLFNACSRNTSESQLFCNIARIADGGESKRLEKFKIEKNLLFFFLPNISKPSNNIKSIPTL